MKGIPKKVSAKLNQYKNGPEHLVFIGVVMFLSIFLTVALGILPAQYELEEGEISADSIYATRTVIDQEATKLARAAAGEQVEDFFTYDATVEGKVTDSVTALLTSLLAHKTAEEALPPPVEDDPEDSDAPDPDQEVEQPDPVENYRLEQAPQLLAAFPELGEESNALSLLALSREELQTTLELVTSLIHSALQPGIKSDAVESTRQGIKAELLQAPLDPLLKEQLASGLDANFKPNRIYSPEETAIQRRRAMDQVEDVLILKGVKIIDKGEAVTATHLSQLRALGMLETSFAYGYYLGLALLILCIFTAWAYYLYRYRPGLIASPSKLWLIGLVIILTLWAAKFFGGLIFGTGSLYLIPAGMVSLLLAIIFDVNLALYFGATLALVIAITAGGEFNVFVMALIGVIAGAYSVSKVNQRSDLTRAGLLIALANVVGILGLTLIGNGLALTPASVQRALGDLAMGIASGVLSSVFAIGLLPFIESAFKITTSIRLLELANPNQTPLKRLLLEAPGTYHHSIMVGNLAEAAAESVGADPVLCRVGSYYHDLGKLSRPYFFIENQFQGNNPHDRIPPSLSSMILTAHVRNGVDLAKQYRLPTVLKDIIQQHHGTTLISFFYHRALTERGGKDHLLEEKFRYEGPKPQFKEAGIIMLADSVEAAIRSLAQPSQFRIQGMVDKIVQEKLADGQLDQCDLTLRDLSLIAGAFTKVFVGMYHKRIAYPTEKDLGRLSS